MALLVAGLDEFLADNPLMSAGPVGATGTIAITGEIIVNLKHQNLPTVSERLQICIHIPATYPAEPPAYKELGNVIPHYGEYHTFVDGRLCLASPFSLQLALAKNSDFNHFHKLLFVPYIYAVMLKIRHGISFVFGELEHGLVGKLEGLMQEFEMPDPVHAVSCLAALSLKKRIANKRPCPCNCGKRLGVCRTRSKLNPLRMLFPRTKYARLRKEMLDEVKESISERKQS